MNYTIKKETRLEIFNFLDAYIDANNHGGFFEVIEKSDRTRLIRTGDDYFTLIAQTFVDNNWVLFKVYFWELSHSATIDHKLSYNLKEVPKAAFFINNHEDVYFLNDEQQIPNQRKTFFTNSDNSWVEKRLLHSLWGHLDIVQKPDIERMNSVL